MSEHQDTGTGRGFTWEISGDELTIRVDLSHNGGTSKSGKSIIVATSAGNISLPGGNKLGLNVYRSKSSE